MVDTVVTWSKDPKGVLDYLLDWTQYLPVGDTITASTWSVANIQPADVTPLVVGTTTHTAATTTVWLSGGTVGVSYVVENQIVTTNGRTDERSCKVTVKER